jgi:stage II sporulation protein D
MAQTCLLVAVSCRQEQTLVPILEPTASPLRSVRVLVASRVERLHLRTDGALTIDSDTGLTLHTVAADGGVSVSVEPGTGLRFDDIVVAAAAVVVQSPSQNPIHLAAQRSGPDAAPRSYPGALRLVASPDGRLDAVNIVDLEPYVACVVANEVWPSFESEAYRAQAIASRTFVVYQMERRKDAPFDVSSTQGSQVYRGLRTDTTGRRALEAAHYTRGLVCTFRDAAEERLFCAYYSAACGGMSQSASIFGNENDIPPLAGGVACDHCKIAPGDSYRWGPVRLTKSEITARLASSSPEFSALGVVQSISIAEKTRSGRVVRLRLTGSSGESREVLGERFRLAVGGNLIRSTDFKLRETENEMIFENGRGFGHGLGLCQWGMEGLAKQGKTAAEILGFYYPGSTLTRLY